MRHRTHQWHAPILALLGVFASAPMVGAQARLPDLSNEIATVRQVLASDPVRNALQYVDQRAYDETIEEWLALCRAPGPTGDEIFRARLIYRLFRMYGLENVRIDQELNVIGIRRGVGEGPTVVLNSHYDNVPLQPKEQPIHAFVADGRVWCPAAGDDLLGTTQLLTVLRALNAGNIQTQGDIWFVTFPGEEPNLNDVSLGAAYFVNSNYPHHLDWRRGNIIVQFHGGGGEGVTTGSTPVQDKSQLRVFVPLDWNRWGPHAMDALGPILQRVMALRDPRAYSDTPAAQAPADEELMFNAAQVGASDIINGTAREVWVRFDIRADTRARVERAHEAIRRIAADVTTELGEGYTYAYEVMSKNGVGTDEPALAGWDKANNPPARMAAAAAQVLYGVTPMIDPTRGCGDCVRSYREGFPAFSLRGNVVDHRNGEFELRRGRGGLQSEVRRKTGGHDVTTSGVIENLWSGVKHGLVFAVSYAGLAR